MSKKGDKKKGAKAAAPEDDDDLEFLNQAAAANAAAQAAAAAAAPAAPAASKGAKEPAPAANKEDSDGEGEGDDKVDAKTLANRKKKDKKKAKGGAESAEAPAPPAPAAAAAAAASTEGAGPEPDEDDEDDSKGGKDKKGKKGAKDKAKKEEAPKKETAAVKAARERMELQKKWEEEKRIFEEQERRRIEAEEKARREQEELEEAEREKKRLARLAKKQKQKEDGTFMTKKQKENAARAAMLREQFGFTLQKEEKEEGEEAEDRPSPKRSAGFKKKKKPQGGAQAKEDEEEPQESATAQPAASSKAPEPAKPAESEEDEDDDWEKVADRDEEDPKQKKDEDESEEEEDDESDSSSSSSFLGYRSPIICIMGHVDTGKTKLLDKIRRTNVQEGEAGGITQQIGATFFPDIALAEQTKKVDPDFEIEVPGIMIIDTPGHESFNNLRARGSSLCDLAILVIDIVHGLEPQTVESLMLLQKRRCPFIIALNKVDRIYGWNTKENTPVREALERQEASAKDEFKRRLDGVILQLQERGLNSALYWENEDPRSIFSIVPTSALTGEGVCDLLYLLIKLNQEVLHSKIEIEEELQCTVIEVKNIEGLGTTIDVVLVNGTLREGDTIVVAGITAPIVTTVRALLTPQPMKEMRVKNEYIHHQKISMSMGVKICAPGLEEAVAGCQLLVCGPDDDLEELKEEVSSGFDSMLSNFEKQPEGVYVKASTLGSLEALLSFLQDMKIPVFDVGIGEVHKKDVKKALIMKEKKHPEYAVILAFDVKVNSEALKQAATDDVQIFTADIIYHLQDKFKQYMDKIRESQKTETRKEAIFPVILQIDRQMVFRKHDPILVGCNVVGGQLRIGTPICVPEKDFLVIGHVGGIQKDKKDVQIARRGDSVCVKIEQNTQQNVHFGRHFDHTHQLYSLISRGSIDTLKEHFKDEMKKEDWELIIAMKTLFKIQ